MRLQGRGHAGKALYCLIFRRVQRLSVAGLSSFSFEFWSCCSYILRCVMLVLSSPLIIVVDLERRLYVRDLLLKVLLATCNSAKKRTCPAK